MKCTMADKSTKTDESLLNGDLEVSCPTTTNAATMTTVVTCESPVSNARPSSQTVNATSTRTSSSAHQVPRPDPPKQSTTPPPPLVSLEYVIDVLLAAFQARVLYTQPSTYASQSSKRTFQLQLCFKDRYTKYKH